MKKNLGLFVMALSLSSASFAEKASTGFYMGVYGGANFNATKLKQDDNTSATGIGDRVYYGEQEILDPAKTDGSKIKVLSAIEISGATRQATFKVDNMKKYPVEITSKGVPSLGVMAGYAYGFGSCMVLGFEAFIGFDGTNNTVAEWSKDGFAYRFKAKRGLNYRANILVGYLITPNTQVHVKFGIDGGAFKYKNEVTDGTLDSGMTAVIDPAKPLEATKQVLIGDAGKTLEEKKSRAINFAIGGGMRTYIQKNVFVEISYAYVFGNKTKLDATGQADFKDKAKVDTLTTPGDLKTAPKANIAGGKNLNPGVEFTNNQHRITVTLGYKF